jgi:hypothetical protein
MIFKIEFFTYLPNNYRKKYHRIEEYHSFISNFKNTLFSNTPSICEREKLQFCCILLLINWEIPLSALGEHTTLRSATVLMHTLCTELAAGSERAF